MEKEGLERDLDSIAKYLAEHKEVFTVTKQILLKCSESKQKKKKRESSLKHICTQILDHYSDQTEVEIHLNEYSKKLNVERRRIYDIVNILEGFDIFKKKVKNIYVWKGLDEFIFKLKMLEALKPEQAAKIKFFKFEKISQTNKKKSLTFLSLRFLRAFCAKTSEVSFKSLLAIFAEKEKSQIENKSKSGKNKVRRLYDIVNVFKAIGLIDREKKIIGKDKYVWSGSKGLARKLKEIRSLKNDTLSVNITDSNHELTPFHHRRFNSEEIHLETSGFKVVRSCQDLDIDRFRRIFLTKRNLGEDLLKKDFS